MNKRVLFLRKLSMAVAAGAVMSLAASQAMAGVAVPAGSSRHHEYGAIFQLDSGGNHAIKKTLNNIENLIKDPRVKGHIHVELIANSGGFDVYVKNNGFEKKLRQLQKDGVILAQCANTLREKHVNRNKLYSFIKIVPSGVGEITLREAEGWAYIHPAPPPADSL